MPENTNTPQPAPAPVWLKTFGGVDRNGNSRRLWLQITAPDTLEVYPENPGPPLRTQYLEIDITPAEHNRLAKLVRYE